MPGIIDEKKQDDQRVKQLREFQRSNAANKRCFDCCEMVCTYLADAERIHANDYICKDAAVYLP